MRRLTAAPLLLSLLACGAGDGPAAQASREAAGISAEAIEGVWRITSVNGRTPAGFTEDKGSERTPRISFSPTTYGGTSGCNFFGGLGFLEEGRYYAAPAGQTAMGCGDLTAQEDAVTGIFWSAPQVRLQPDGTLSLTGEKHKLALRRDPSLAERQPRSPAGPEPTLLAGSSWQMSTLDGQSLKGPPLFRFDGNSWSGRVGCATLSAGWRQEGDRVILTSTLNTTDQHCPPHLAVSDGRLAALMKARPRFVTGPNGEILVAGGGHWLMGQRSR